MKSQVNFVYDMGDDPQDELKHWLFLENVRLQQERQELNEEKQKLHEEKMINDRELTKEKQALEIQEKKLCRQKDLFEKQWNILETELRKLAKDKAALEKERDNLKKLQSQTRTNVVRGDGRFFAGVNSGATLKKRYRELLKIYHPDNEAGDENTVLQINQEYKSLKRQFGID